jgi:hypothetical protein
MVDSGRKKRLKVLEEILKVTDCEETCVNIENKKMTGFRKENVKLCNRVVLN